MERLYTYDDLADILQIKSQTLRLYKMNGQIPFTQIGRSIRFTREQIEQIIKEGLRSK